jgi:hypothetical protein
MDVLSFVGGTGVGMVAVFGFSSFLGKVWAARILEADRRKYAAEIEGVKSGFAASLARLQGELEKASHVHRIQFEREYQLLSEIWGALARVRSSMQPLHATAVLGPPGQTTKERVDPVFAQFRKDLDALKVAVDHHSPFYPQTLHGPLDAAIRLADREDVESGWKDGEGPGSEAGRQRFSEYRARMDEIATIVRDYLDNLRVTES